MGSPDERKDGTPRRRHGVHQRPSGFNAKLMNLSSSANMPGPNLPGKEKEVVRLIILIISFVCMTLTGTASGALPNTGDYEIEYREGLVSARGEEVPAMAVLEKLAEIVGMEVFIFGAPPSSPVSLDLKNKSPETALRILLRGINYAVVHNPASGIRGVRIVQAQQAPRKAGDAQQASGDGGGSKKSAQANPTGPSQTPVEAGAGISSSGRGSDQGPLSTAAVPSARPSTGGSGGSPNGPGQAGPGASAGSASAGASSTGGQAGQAGAGAQGSTGPSASSGSGLSPAERLQKIISVYEKRIASGESDRNYEVSVGLMGEGHVTHDRERVVFFQNSLKKHQGQ